MTVHIKAVTLPSPHHKTNRVEALSIRLTYKAPLKWAGFKGLKAAFDEHVAAHRGANHVPPDAPWSSFTIVLSEILFHRRPLMAEAAGNALVQAAVKKAVEAGQWVVSVGCGYTVLEGHVLEIVVA